MLQFKEKQPPEQVIIKFPFADYAAKFWMTFAAVSEDESQELLDLIEQFFCFQKIPYIVCYAPYRPDQPWLEYKDIQEQGIPGSPLYYAASGNLQSTVRVLLKKNADVDAKGGYYGNALKAASAVGHEQMVKLLLEKSADVNAQCGFYGNAL